MRKAFTLVELLIVVLILAVLSGMMMLSSMEVNAMAQVAQVVSDLNAMKKAVLLYVQDHPDEYMYAPNCVPPTADCILPYLDKSFSGYRKTVRNANRGNVKEVELYRSETDFLQLRIMIDPANDITADSEPGELSGKRAWFIFYKMPPYMTDNGIFRRKLAEAAKSEGILDFAEQKPHYYEANNGGYSKCSDAAIMRIL